jgi:hypothetical protein
LSSKHGPIQHRGDRWVVAAVGRLLFVGSRHWLLRSIPRHWGVVGAAAGAGVDIQVLVACRRRCLVRVVVHMGVCGVCIRQVRARASRYGHLLSGRAYRGGGGSVWSPKRT